MPLNHIPALNENSVFIDLRVVKNDFTMNERNDFLVDDLGCEVTDLKAIFPDPTSMLLRVTFKTEALFDKYLALLSAGVRWSACNNTLVYGWAPGDSVTNVRVSGVMGCFTAADIRAHFQQFGRVTRAYIGRDRFFPDASTGIVHLSISIAPGFTLPHFIEVVDEEGLLATRLHVHTDVHRRRCARCGDTGHVGNYCRAGRRSTAANAALWSRLRIPPTLLPPPSPYEDIAALEAAVLPLQPTSPAPALAAAAGVASTPPENSKGAAIEPALAAAAVSEAAPDALSTSPAPALAAALAASTPPENSSGVDVEPALAAAPVSVVAAAIGTEAPVSQSRSRSLSRSRSDLHMSSSGDAGGPSGCKRPSKGGNKQRGKNMKMKRRNDLRLQMVEASTSDPWPPLQHRNKHMKHISSFSSDGETQ